jgi:hypothetical protein
MLLDAALWALALMLFAGALRLTLRAPPAWDAAGFFRAALAARRGDVLPEGTGPELSPGTRIAHGIDWSDLGTPRADDARARRLADSVLVWCEPAPMAIPGLETHAIALPPFDPHDTPGWSDASVARIAPLLPRPQLRVVLAAHARARDVLRLLHAAPGLRDRVRAVVLVHPELDRDWLTTHLTHEAFDVEVLRDVPWVHLRARDEAPLPALPEPETGRTCVAVVDVGVVEPVDDAHVAEALADTLASLT